MFSWKDIQEEDGSFQDDENKSKYLSLVAQTQAEINKFGDKINITKCLVYPVSTAYHVLINYCV